ncbi:MAG: sulfite exporter TauE/SafE family protein [Phycisphaerales bacterium]|nr:sulfite exporter TauE/SafE family protein [Phycisphaerales bacterium]
MIIIILTLAALVTATISGIIGMGGGILLLAVMFGFMAHAEAIPLHGAAQLVSNGSRVVAYWSAVDWKTVGQFFMGTLPGVAVAGLILWMLGVSGEPGAADTSVGSAEPYLKIVIGLYILVVVVLPKPKKTVRPGHGYDFTLLGFVAGAASLTVGATGPLIAPLFAHRNFVKEHLIATKAICQVSTHALKIIAFAALGTIEFMEFSSLLIPMSIAAVIGTFLGKRILRHVSREAFVKLYRVALTVAGTKVLIVDGLLKAVGWTFFEISP